MTLDNILEVSNLHLKYGKAHVLHGISFEVARRSLTSIIGPNGAGKSSNLGAIAGGVKVAAGSIRLDGQPIESASPELIAQRGISFVPEGRHVFGSLTVEENLMAGSFVRSKRAAAKARLQRIYGYFPRLGERSRQPAGKLSGGEQQMLVIGRALMTKPCLMLIDEPSLGLAPKVVDEVYDILCRIRNDEGTTIVVNEQSFRRVMKYADQILVLRAGRIQLRGAPDTLGQGHAVHDAYFGLGTFDANDGRTQG